MTQAFEDGAQVRLKSGGPVMTVVNFRKYHHGSHESYKCRWFDQKNNVTEAVFTEAELGRA